jgi:hypothetical protein
MGKITFSALACLLVAAGALAAEHQAAATAQVCTEVKDRTPQGVADRFPATVGELFCFSEVSGGQPGVVHLWYHGDKELFRIELPVRAPHWRTWSAKRIPPAMTGAWRVEVRDSSGNVLATAKFTVD